MRLSLVRWAFHTLFPISKKLKKQMLCAAAVGLISLPMSASAQFSAPGVGGLGPIADGAGTGTSGAPSISTATIAGGGPVADVRIDFGQGGLVHTWAGDLTVSLTHPNGSTVIDVLRRPGRSGAGGTFPTSTFGFNNDFVAGDSYAFGDAGADVFNVSPGPTQIPSGNYRSTSNPADPGDPSPPAVPYVYTPTSFASTFGGLDAGGAWTLEVRDWGGGDTGSLNGWTLHVDVVPEPASFGLISALVGLGLLARRRIA